MRVLLLAELLVLGYADWTVLYQRTGSLEESLRLLPRAGFAAAVLWAFLFLLADMGLGVVAASFGGLVVAAFVLGQAGLLTQSFERYLTNFSGGGSNGT